jgi:hypothetical protein
MTVREDFETRKDEVSLYFEMLELIEQDKPKLTSYDLQNQKEQVILFDNKRINMLRSSACLLLYNLIESTVYNAVKDIFDEINSSKHGRKLGYIDVIDKIKKYWLNNIYKHDDKIKKATVVNSFFEISNRIFNQSLELSVSDDGYYNLKYGGSLDARKIRETAEDLGIDTSNTSILQNGYDEKTHGEALLRIKQNRNLLAHGKISFTDIGKDSEQLPAFKNYIFEHLERFVASVENFINSKGYLKETLP